MFNDNLTIFQFYQSGQFHW